MAHASTKGDIPRREFHGSKAYFGRFASRMCRSAQYLDQEYPYIDYGTNEGGNDSGGDPTRASVMPFKQQDSPDNKWNPCIWPIVIPIIDSNSGRRDSKQATIVCRADKTWSSQAKTANTRISMARVAIGWWIKAAMLPTRMRTSAPMAALPRDGNCCSEMIRCRFTERATMTGPTKAAEAPAAATKNSVQVPLR